MSRAQRHKQRSNSHARKIPKNKRLSNQRVIQIVQNVTFAAVKFLDSFCRYEPCLPAHLTGGSAGDMSRSRSLSPADGRRVWQRCGRHQAGNALPGRPEARRTDLWGRNSVRACRTWAISAANGPERSIPHFSSDCRAMGLQVWRKQPWLGPIFAIDAPRPTGF